MLFQIFIQVTDNIAQIRGHCSATMKKNTDYLVKFELCSARRNITKSTCACVAGQGLSAACKHIAALICCIEDFVTTGKLKKKKHNYVHQHFDVLT